MMQGTLKRIAAAAAAAIAMVTVAACGGSSSDGSGGGSTGDGANASMSRLVVNSATPPASLDPSTACNLPDIALISDLYVTLLKHGTKAGPDDTQQEDATRLVPYLAKSWTVSDDGKTYTFKLDPAARFPSGAPTDARAVKYSFERDLKMGSCGAYFLNVQEPRPLIESMTTPDAHTIVFKLAKPNAEFPHALTSPVLGIVDPSLIEQNGGVKSGTPNRWMASHSAGSGPYVLASYEPGTKAVYTANPTFFGDRPKVPRVEINFVTADPTLLLQARSGQADVTLGLSAQSLSSLRGDGSLRIVSTPAVASQFISFPTQTAPFDNATFRNALSYAIPYQDILRNVLAGYGESYFGPFAPAAPEADASLEAPRSPDMDKAKELVRQSGVKTPVSLTMYTQEGQTDQQKIATIAQGAWKDLGVDVTIKQLAPAAFADAVAAPRKDYSLVRYDGPAVPNALWQVPYDMICGSPFNISQYCNRQVESDVYAAIASSDEATRTQHFDAITRQWIADAPRIPVYQQNFTVALKDGIGSYTFAQEDDLFHTWGP